MFNRTGSATHVLMDGATACMTNRQASFSFQERFGLHIFEYSYGQERERERETTGMIYLKQGNKVLIIQTSPKTSSDPTIKMTSRRTSFTVFLNCPNSSFSPGTVS